MNKIGLSKMKKTAPEEIERVHVNQVYDKIAKHFDHTRYKPWPGVKNFVSSLKPYSLLLDLGCGNGRNLCINTQIIDMGTDISMPLCEFASKQGRPIFRSSAINIPIKNDTLDHIICIAVIHHFASEERRIQCLKEISRILKVGGTAFVTAWAFEQKSRVKIDDADQMVPWNSDARFTEKSDKLDRFYHFFKKGEFAKLAESVPSLKLKSEEWEKDNWNATFEKIQ